jgi:hypothetical protein
MVHIDIFFSRVVLLNIKIFSNQQSALQREYINISFLDILEKKNICFLFKKMSDSNRSLCVEKEEKKRLLNCTNARSANEKTKHYTLKNNSTI